MKVCRNMMNASRRVQPHHSYRHNRAEQLNTSCMPYSSSNVHHASPGLGLRVPSGLGRMVLRVILLLLVLSGDIESNPGPVGQPTLEDLSDVRGALFEARAKWYDIGIELKLSIGTLSTIREDFPQAADCLREMCINWLKRIDPSPSWAALAKALESPPVGEEHLAQQLRDKYCRGREEMITRAHPIPGPSPTGAPPTPQVPHGESHLTSAMTSSPLPSPIINDSCAIPPTSQLTTPPHQPSLGHNGSTKLCKVADQVKHFENRFGILVNKACQDVMKRKLQPSVFLSRVTTLPVSDRAQHRSFIEKELKDIPPPVTFDKIWTRLTLYWDFLNYGLLEHVINQLGSEDLKYQMQDYVDELFVFKRRTRLCDFIDNWPCRDNRPQEKGLRKVVVKMDLEWTQCTLQDVESFKTALIHKFFLPEFDLILQNAEKGCVCVTWLTSLSTATQLRQNLPNIEMEFFKTHAIERVTIAGEDCFLTPMKKFANYLKGVYTSEKPLPTVESSLPADELLPFNLAKIEKEEMDPSEADMFIRASIRGDIDDVLWQKEPMNIDEVGVLPDGSQPKLVLIEGAPGVGKSTFSWDFCTKWGRSEALQDYSLLLLLPLRDNRLKEATGLSDLFYHPDPNIQKAVLQGVKSMRGKGVLIWLEAFDELHEDKRTRSSIFLDLIYGKVLPDSTIFLTSRPWATVSIAEKCKDRISQRIEILASADLQIKQYMEKTKSDPNTAAKFRDYLSFNPAVKAMMYTPMTADMVTKTFLFSRVTESPPPTTRTELYTTFTQTLLLKYLSSHPVHGTEQRKTLTFDDLPDDIHNHYTKLCEVAYVGILTHQLVFPADQVDFDPLCLMQETPQLYAREGSPSSFHFLHLTLQEYLAAVHMSQLPSREQTKLIEQHLRHGHFKMVFRFLAGLTKLENITPNIVDQLVHRHGVFTDDRLTLFYWLFESHSDSTTLKVLNLDKMNISFSYMWTPLDFYVTGYCVAHCQCNWRFDHRLGHGGCIDDGKLELFSKGCHSSSTTTDCGCISSVNFGGGNITSEGIEHFLNIPQHIRQGIRELVLYLNKLDVHACDILATAVPEMPMLQELDLNSNPAIGSGGAVSLIRALYTSRVKTLGMEDTGISEEDCVCLGELLKSNPHLECLDVTCNNLSSESVKMITSGVVHSSSLRTLNMSQSQFSVAAVVNLASLLSEQSNCKLVELRLQLCNISSEGVAALATALCKNSILHTLDLSFNPIGREGAAAIAQMLPQNRTLRVMYLRDESVGEEGVRQLVSSLDQNSTLDKIVLPIKYKYISSSNPRILWSWLR